MTTESWTVSASTLTLQTAGDMSRPALLESVRQIVSCDAFNDIQDVLILVREIAAEGRASSLPVQLHAHLAGMRARLGRVPVVVVVPHHSPAQAIPGVLAIASELALPMRVTEDLDEARRWLLDFRKQRKV